MKQSSYTETPSLSNKKLFANVILDDDEDLAYSSVDNTIRNYNSSNLVNNIQSDSNFDRRRSQEDT
jgi:hypothetical protein